MEPEHHVSNWHINSTDCYNTELVNNRVAKDGLNAARYAMHHDFPHLYWKGAAHRHDTMFQLDPHRQVTQIKTVLHAVSCRCHTPCIKEDSCNQLPVLHPFWTPLSFLTSCPCRLWLGDVWATWVHDSPRGLLPALGEQKLCSRLSTRFAKVNLAVLKKLKVNNSPQTYPHRSPITGGKPEQVHF